MEDKSRFLSSYTLPNGVELKNRIMMAPMTTCTGYHDGTVTEELVEYYSARAGSIGAIIVECCYIDPLGAAFPGALGITTDDHIYGLSKIAKAIQAKGTKAILQLYHGGRMVDPLLIGGRQPVGATGIPAPRPNMPIPRELTAQEVEDMIQKFGQAVRRAIQAGFDGVEIHGANTYLIQQFYSGNSNQRTDEWGGNREKRAKFPCAIVDITEKMVKQYADDSFIVGYRFSPEELEPQGITWEDSMYLLELLAEKDVIDYFHISLGYYLRPSILNKEDKTALIDKYIKQRSQRLAKIPIVGVGAIVNAENVISALDHGYDLVAVGHACIAYPDWVDRIANGEQLKLFIDSTKREELFIPEPLWRFPLVGSMIIDTSAQESRFKPGTYTEQVQDDDKELVIDVTLEQDKISEIVLKEAPEMDVEFKTSFEEIRSRILEKNTPHVDAVSGATNQSEAVKRAVKKAISESSRILAKEEGGDLPLIPDDYEIVVIGTGGAGMSAAIQAHDEGCRVLIVEKMPTIGGNTIKSSVGMNAAETRYQKIKGIKDSKDLFYEETMKGGKNMNNPLLLRRFVDRAPEAIEWLAHRGIMLNDITITGGMSVDRAHRPRDSSAVGGYLVSGLLRNVNKRNIDIMTDTRVIDILVDENKRVYAVKLIVEEETEVLIHCKAVIVATGGFSANQEMVVKYRPELKGFVTTNHKGATGEGIILLERIGAGTVDMDQIQIHPTVEQTTSYLISESIRGGGAILVNQKGERFFNELETRDKVSAAIIALPEKYSYIIFDEQIHQKNKATDEYITKGLTVSADSPEELAKKIGLDVDTFKKTLERFNTFVEKQHDDDFGRTTGLRSKINQGPYFAIKIAPGVHHTMGGITINVETEVLDKDSNVIKGAYAAGEVCGGIHGGNRIGGNAVADIIIFGTLAGHNAAVYAQNLKK
ncbi:flavocytochrome c [Histomonas meleagridis]|uniref:flavocytochrome c n=1 Tax=Histomonas meleagridis TaxID=135588 RepID=UPI00355A6E30|nr:flavocytochrome c [Histomonas meleagridis]KAH0799047.1 flavocytochrome c [Histomonas meleagridis]